MAKSEEKVHMTIEELKEKHRVSDAIFEGVKAAKNWKPGKLVEEDEFVKVCDGFKKAPVDGRDMEVKG